MLSPDPGSNQSPCSSDTGEVLIRSTRVFVPDRGRDKGPGAGSQPIHITVQKLRQPPQPHRAEQKKRRQRPSLEPDVDEPPRGTATPQSGQELLTSCFTAGGRGAVLGALRQRCHIAHHKREVAVQLLEPRTLQDTSALSARGPAGVAGVQTEPKPSSGRLGDPNDAAAAAVAAAAAIAAAAPLIKAQSEIEARMSQLADSVQQLLHTNREAEGRERSLSQQTLQHLEALHSQQLQLQSQLLESAVKIVTGHTSATSNWKAAAANNVSNQQLSSSVTADPAAVATVPVSMKTCGCDCRPAQTRNTQCLQNASIIPTIEDSHLQSVASETQEAVRRARDTLREMESLKMEIKTLLMQPGDSQDLTRPGPDKLQKQQNQLEPQQSQSQQHPFQSHQNHSQPSSDHQQVPQSSHPQFQHKQSDQNRTQYLQSHQGRSEFQNLQSNQTTSQPNHQAQSNQSKSTLVQRRPVQLSMLEEAGQVLRQVRRRKKVLEDNLDSLCKAKTGEILHCQLEALAANRDLNEEVRIKKTVDAWISTLTRELQTHGPPSPPHAEICRSANAVTSQGRATGRGKPMSTLRRAGCKPVTGSRGQKSGHRVEAEPSRDTAKSMDHWREKVDRESYLSHLYGKLPHEGLRRTLKKSPYPRFSSPASPAGRKHRPQLVESIRGVRLKSCKTQTCLAPPITSTAGPQLVLSSSHPSSQPADSHPVAMAIPLGRPRMDSSSRRERPQRVTLVPPAPLSTGVVTVDTGAADQQQQAEEKGPSPPSHIVEILEVESQKDVEEEEENALPGSDFVVQEEDSNVGEEAVVLDGGPPPAPVLYHGPAFPPEALSSHQAQNVTPVVGVSQQDSLENRLVEWVEQQLMSRIVSDFYRPPVSDPTQNDHAEQSEPEERSPTSDIVEAAGGGGLQLFVDANISVDSELIRRLVNEVLTEIVAQVLGQRDASDVGQEPGLEAPISGLVTDEEEKLDPVVPTPVPTPLPSVVQPSTETTPVTTPPPSKPPSPLSRESPQPVPAPEPITTPPSTPESPSAAHQAPPPLTWGDAELPLEEEKPEEQLETDKEQLIMTVAEEEPPVCSPMPPPPPSQSAPPEPGPSPPSISSEDLSSSSSTSTTSSSSTVTEAALKHISEGELLISVNQLAPLMEDEVVYSFSSSLQELQDMDFDPPTVEQVRGHNLLLTLLTKMDQGVTPRGERLQPEGSWGRTEEMEDEASVGEVRGYEAAKHLKATKPTRQDSPSYREISQAAAGQQEEQEKQEETRKMDVHLPSIRPQEEEEEVGEKKKGEDWETLGAAADTDSSTNDDF